ncbi:MAG TPA: IS200/IS605 family transposase [Thermomicrobiales bacterium]
MGSSYWRFYVHLIWATKGREPLIGEAEEAVIRRSWKITNAELGVIPHAIGVMPDHVHLALSVPPRIAVAELVRRLKGASSHAVNHVDSIRSTGSFGWQPEYGGLTFGERSLPRVVSYIDNHRQHHTDNTLWPILERITDDR